MPRTQTYQFLAELWLRGPCRFCLQATHSTGRARMVVTMDHTATTALLMHLSWYLCESRRWKGSSACVHSKRTRRAEGRTKGTGGRIRGTEGRTASLR